MASLTLRANTVFPPFSIHRVTAPPAPSPKLPNSSIRFSILATLHPSSSNSSTSKVLPLSKLNLSNASSPVMLPSRSIPTPPSLRSEYSDPTAEAGSGVPWGCRNPYCDANDKAEYWDPAEVGPLTLPSNGPKLPDLECAALLSLPPLADWFAFVIILGRPFCRPPCS